MTDFQFRVVVSLVQKTFRNCKTIEEYEKAVQDLDEFTLKTIDDNEKTKKGEVK
jgi:hypothetical protein